MITPDNVKAVFEQISKEGLLYALDHESDYLLVELHIFNAGAIVSIEAMDYDEEKEQEAADNGNLFCDKDDFLRLWEESGADQEHIKDYL